MASVERARSVTAPPAVPEARPPDAPVGVSGGCPGCGRRISVWGRLGRGGFCGSCGPAEKERVEHRRGLFLGALTAVDFDTELTPRQRQIVAETSPHSVGAAWHRQRATSAIRFLLDEALRDDNLTEAEEHRIRQVATLVGIAHETVLDGDPELADRFVLARARDGRLPVAPATPLTLRRREVCHYKARAELLESQFLATQTAPNGLWIPKGVAFDAAGYRALHAKVPTRSRAIDRGVLGVTDRRLVFRGRQQLLEVSYDDLIGLTLLRDGLRLRVRRLPFDLALRTTTPHLVAGLALAASQQPRKLRKR